MEKIYVDGLITFPPHENAPDFVKGTLIIWPRKLIDFIKANEKWLTEYQGQKQLKCQILESQKGGFYFTVDTYRKDEVTAEPEPQTDDDLPF